MKRRKTVSLAKLKKRAWALLSECVRREAINPQEDETWIGCYTCDAAQHWKYMQAGHAIGGRNGAVLFDEEIIRPQCVRCNIMLRGNYGEFIARLIREKALSLSEYPDAGHGMAALGWWQMKLSAAKQIKKWTRDELQEKIDSYKARLEKLG